MKTRGRLCLKRADHGRPQLQVDASTFGTRCSSLALTKIGNIPRAARPANTADLRRCSESSAPAAERNGAFVDRREARIHLGSTLTSIYPRRDTKVAALRLECETNRKLEPAVIGSAAAWAGATEQGGRFSKERRSEVTHRCAWVSMVQNIVG